MDFIFYHHAVTTSNCCLSSSSVSRLCSNDWGWKEVWRRLSWTPTIGPICKLVDSKFLNNGLILVAYQWASCWNCYLAKEGQVSSLRSCSSLGWSSLVFANCFSTVPLLLRDVWMGLTSLHGILLKASQCRDHFLVDEEILRDISTPGSHKQNGTIVSFIFCSSF